MPRVGLALRANLAAPAIGARRHDVLHQVLHAQDVLAVVFDEVGPIPAGFVREVAVHAAMGAQPPDTLFLYANVLYKASQREVSLGRRPPTPQSVTVWPNCLTTLTTLISIGRVSLVCILKDADQFQAAVAVY